ncbi:MAG TPA: hypothetical protein VFP37_11300 [Steroidobacteraceae bacterium]|nr:hypothetical protein [Steroidobacteraceae bacterium]
MTPEHNPYLPPSAAVEDVYKPGLGKRPASVIVAVVLLALGLLYSASATLRMLDYYRTGMVGPIFFIWTLARWAFVTLVCVQLWRGRNWARVLLVFVTALSLLTIAAQVWSYMRLPAGVNLPLGVVGLISMLLTPLINLTAVFLVYVPGRAWFRRA